MDSDDDNMEEVVEGTISVFTNDAMCVTLFLSSRPQAELLCILIPPKSILPTPVLCMYTSCQTHEARKRLDFLKPPNYSESYFGLRLFS